MHGIRYIQAQDLRLGAAFTGLGHKEASPGLIRLLDEATFIALDRLVRLCESQRPDFLVLTGNICKRGEAGLKAFLKLREAFLRLEGMELPVYIATNDKDPLLSHFQSCAFPPNVHVFSAERPELFEFEAWDKRGALVHGLSGGIDQGVCKPASLFQPMKDGKAFQLAVLPWAVENSGQPGSSDRWNLVDLEYSGMDAWALAQSQEASILCEKPFIACSGSVQGLDIDAAGSHGCLLIQAEEKDGSWRCSQDFHSLAPVRWQQLHLTMERDARPEELKERLGELLQGELEKTDPSVSAIIAKLSISCDAGLDSWLRKEGHLEDLRPVFTDHSSGHAICALQDVKLESNAEGIWRQSMAREDLLGETIRVYAALSENPGLLEAAGNEALAQLQKFPRLADLASSVGVGGLQELLFQAETLCMDILEKR